MKADAFMSKKVFFLYPHSVIKQELVQELVANEYAVYLVSDHKKFRAVLPQFEEPIVFINIDENLDAEEWQQYISEIIEADNISARIGILTYNEDKDLAQTYLMDLGVQCVLLSLNSVLSRAAVLF